MEVPLPDSPVPFVVAVVGRWRTAVAVPLVVAVVVTAPVLDPSDELDSVLPARPLALVDGALLVCWTEELSSATVHSDLHLQQNHHLHSPPPRLLLLRLLPPPLRIHIHPNSTHLWLHQPPRVSAAQEVVAAAAFARVI